MEATVGIEPTNEGFADPCLTTWLRRPSGTGGVSLVNLGEWVNIRTAHPVFFSPAAMPWMVTAMMSRTSAASAFGPSRRRRRSATWIAFIGSM